MLGITREEQLEIERSNDLEAATERLHTLRTAAADGDLSLPHAQRFISRVCADVQRYLQVEYDTQTRGVGGKYRGWLRKVKPEVAALIAIRTCLSTILSVRKGKAITVQTLCIGVGQLYELEVRLAEAEAVNPLYMKRVYDQVKERNTTSQKHLSGVYSKAYKQVMKGEMDSQLSRQELLHLGKFGVNACLQAGILTQVRTVGSQGALVYYTISPEVTEYLTKYGDADVAGVIHQVHSVMYCPPDPWTNLHDGGYLSDRRKLHMPLMSLRGVRPKARRGLRAMFTAENMPAVFAAANYIQSIPYSLHEATSHAIRRCWEAGGGALGVPRKNAPTAPECPFPETWDKQAAPEHEVEQFLQWKIRMVQHYNELRQWRGRVREMGGMLKALAGRQGPFWFPVFFDTRGRWYYRSTPNPQGSDISKATIQYAVKKPLGERGLFWLKVVIANHFGFDKARPWARAAWTEEHWPAIERALDAPEDHPDVWGKDNPWCMFAAAWELREALRSPVPEQYESGLVAHMDATCSGLQHFSAMLRDAEGGKYVNLVDSGGPEKADIYRRVAEAAVGVASYDLKTSTSEMTKACAGWWVGNGIARSVAKRPVMTYLYGATLLTTANRIGEEEPELVSVTSDMRRELQTYAARKLFQGIAKAVPSADAAMKWLIQVARDSTNKEGMMWTSPSGFKVLHDYQDYQEKRVTLHSCNMEKVILREYGDSTDPRSMASAIAPNFVHSLDAAHLTLTANRMNASGLYFTGIHDSFGTHLADVDLMQHCIRETFVDMYKDKNILCDFLWEVGGAADVPLMGTLNLEDVRKSEFFFC